MNDSLGDRIKNNYENRYRLYLTRRVPVIIRLDGRAFHSLTKKCEKPYDLNFALSMQITAQKLLEEIQGAKCAYVASDEISILITDFDTIKTDAWFDFNIQKMTSIAASIASIAFTSSYGREGQFDARVFNIPKEEVINYFRWRYQDWLRNSIQMLAQSLYSAKELHKKNQSDLHEMCFQKGQNWNDVSPIFKNGIFRTVDGASYVDFSFLKNTDFSNLFIEKVLYHDA